MPLDSATWRRIRRLLMASAAILLATTTVATTTAWCHGISVFAWLEGERVIVESKFSGGKRPMGATVRVFDPEGKELLTGVTDAHGGWSFDLPQRTALKIVLEAGMGHRGEWTLSAAEVGATSSAAPAKDQTHSHIAAQSGEASSLDPTAQSFEERMQKIVAAELATVSSRLARLEERLDGPHLQDIIGGLGYILGLVGIGAYAQARRLRAENSGKTR